MPSWFDFPSSPIQIIPGIGGGGGGADPTTPRLPGESREDWAVRAFENRFGTTPSPIIDTPITPPIASEPPPTIAPEPTSPYTPDVPMPAPPTFGTPVPPEVLSQLGETDPNAWIGAGLGSWVFGLGRKKLTKAQRAARRLDSLISQSMRKTSRVIIDEAGTLISQPRVWGTGARVLAGIGAGILSGIDVLWPSDRLAPSTLDPRDRAREYEKAQEVFSEELTKYSRVADPKYPGDYINRRIGVDPKTFPLGRDSAVPVGSVFTPFPKFPEVEPEVQDRGRRGIEKIIADRLDRAARRAVRDRTGISLPTPTDIGPPKPAGPSSPSSGSSPRPTQTVQKPTGGIGSGPVARAPARIPTGLPLYLAIGFLGAWLPGILGRSSRGSSALSPMTIPGAGPSPIDTPSSPSSPSSPSPFPSIYSASSSSGADGYCTPRPRGPRRKCLQRAPVKFTGGPRKGKAAGTKCIKFAARKS